MHGGITYSEDGLYIKDGQIIDGWFIGWDYAHCGDYMGYYEKIPGSLRLGEKKWTTEEIRENVQEVCYQLRNKEV